MLKYIQHSTVANVTNANLATIRQIVEKVKHDEEVGIGYMKLCERDEQKKAEGKTEGEKKVIRADSQESYKTQRGISDCR